MLSALLNGKCPRCRSGRMFKKPWYNYGAFTQMNAHCPKCHQRLEPEPGFFFGAMYISYALSVGIFILVFFGTYVLFSPPFWVYMVNTLVVVLVLLPFLFRSSRILYLYWLGGIKYDPDSNKNPS